MATTKLVTAEELALFPEDERYELIRGVLYPVSPSGRPHGRIMTRLSGPLGLYVDQHDLGVVYTGDVGVVLERDPDTVLGPDIAFVRKDRLPPGDEEGFMPFVPNLVIEIASPSNTRPELREKVALYGEAGVPNVWLVEPKPRTITWFHPDGSEEVLTEADVLDGGDVVPGFRLPVADIFR